MKSIAVVALAVSAQAAIDPFAASLSAAPADLSRSASYNPNYANSFAETSWPQNPAIRYPGNLAPAIGVTTIVSPYDSTYGGLPIAAATSFNSAITPTYSNDYASYVPYGGVFDWPYNKPWSPVSPTGIPAVLTNGATGPIVPIVSPAIGQVPFVGQTTYSTQSVVTTPLVNTIYTPTNYPIYSPLVSALPSIPYTASPVTINAFGTTVPVVPAGPVPVPYVPNFGSSPSGVPPPPAVLPPPPAVLPPPPAVLPPPPAVLPPSFDFTTGSTTFGTPLSSAPFTRPLSSSAQLSTSVLPSFSSQPQLSSQAQGTSFAPPVMMAPSNGF